MWGSFWSWLTNLFNPNKSASEKLRGDGTNMEAKAQGSIYEGLGLPTTSNSNNSAETITDQNGINQVQVDATNPIVSASNIINYDPEKSALENMYGYAVDNNSASAYSSFLENKYQSDMANSAISRAIADAEANGISKYQLFQSGNAAAASPSSAGSTWNSYEKSMDRRESWNEKELAAFVAIVTAAMSSAAKIMA